MLPFKDKTYIFIKNLGDTNLKQIEALTYYYKWFKKLDNNIKIKIFNRIKDIKEKGYYGAVEPVGDGVFELKFDTGIRIYFGEYKNEIVLLLNGGNKKNQQKDIDKSKELWKRYLKEKIEK